MQAELRAYQLKVSDSVCMYVCSVCVFVCVCVLCSVCTLLFIFFIYSQISGEQAQKEAEWKSTIAKLENQLQEKSDLLLSAEQVRVTQCISIRLPISN